MTLRITAPVTAVLLASFIASACAGGPPVSTAPAPARGANAAPIAPARAVVPAALKSLTAAPADWQRLSVDKDSVFGTGSERALRELLGNRAPSRRVIVAVIDGGVDTASTLLRANLWHNPKDTPNGKDDDGNGLVDDVIGWNFVGGVNMKSVNFETLEVTRELAACRGLPAGTGTPKPTDAQCVSIAAAYEKSRTEAAQQARQVVNLVTIEQQITQVLKSATKSATLTPQNVSALTPNTEAVGQARALWLELNANGMTGESLIENRIEIDSTLAFGYDLSSTVRTIVGDSIGNLNQHVYGNRDVTGPDAKHGTHVAGIIAATHNSNGVQGIAPFAQIMAVRAVPNGDERDKDIANAIRYAADHGANIINMSFGKSYSPGKSAVDAAVKYAQDKGILFVHAAGNDGANNDSIASFPTAEFLDHSRATAWIEVGASSWHALGDLAAEFSNYGQKNVDLFAPGVDILSTVPGNRTERLSGTSMAAPVVSGVAALVMSYFPKLSAVEVKDILSASARAVDGSVTVPGNTSKVPFSSLSRTGGVVDAYAAVRMAMQRAGSSPQQ